MVSDVVVAIKQTIESAAWLSKWSMLIWYGANDNRKRCKQSCGGVLAESFQGTVVLLCVCESSIYLQVCPTGMHTAWDAFVMIEYSKMQRHELE